jgi:hypothetical protein
MIPRSPVLALRRNLHRIRFTNARITDVANDVTARQDKMLQEIHTLAIGIAIIKTHLTTNDRNAS